MGIEIRPVAVQGQLDEKFKTLSTMLDSIDKIKAVLDGFSQSGSLLSGDGYDAARAHMGQYEKLLDTLEESVRLVREADTNVKGALNDFGGAARVSEDEWRDKKDDAEKRISLAQEKIRNFEADLSSVQSRISSSTEKSKETTQAQLSELSSVMYGLSSQKSLLPQLQANANEAGEMLSRIYAYCEKTNGAYEGTLQDVSAMAASGAAQFASCGFSVIDGKPSWDVIDESSWFNQGIYDAGSYVFDKKGFGEICDVVMADPTVDAILDWWEKDGINLFWNLVDNLGVIVSGALSIAEAIPLCASGVGAPLGLWFITVGLLDVTSGTAGMLAGKKYEWREDMAKTLSSRYGTDRIFTELVVEVSTSTSPIGLAKAPKDIGHLVDLVSDLKSFSKGVDAFPNAGFYGKPSKTGTDLPATDVGAVEVEKKKALAKKAFDVAGDIKDIGELTGMVAGKIHEMKERREDGGYAEFAFAAAGDCR